MLINNCAFILSLRDVSLNPKYTGNMEKKKNTSPYLAVLLRNPAGK